MYTDYYGFQDDVFRLTPSSRQGFAHASYRKARSYISYALERGEGIVLITGVPGTGKTTLVNEVTFKMRQAGLLMTRLTSYQLDGDDFLRQYVFALGLTPDRSDKSAMLEAIERCLRRANSEGAWPVLLIDEAQGLSLGALEDVRLLTNLTVNDQPLLQVLLVGQQSLRSRILTPQLEQLHQRVVASCTLDALTIDECREYVCHRLHVAGWTGEPAFENGLNDLLFQASQGIPRWINLIGSRLLMHGATERKRELSVDDVRLVVDELLGESLLPPQVRSGRLQSVDGGDGSKEGVLEQRAAVLSAG